MQAKITLPDISTVCEVSVKYTAKVKASDRAKISRSKEAADILFPFYDKTGMMEQREVATALLLTRSMQVLGIVKIGEGSAGACVMDLPYLLRAAILANAQNIILCHNHPSGNMKPSRSDIDLTKKIKQAADLVDIAVVEHIILSPEPDTYYSLADNGEI